LGAAGRSGCADSITEGKFKMRAKVLVIYRVTSNMMKIFIKKFSYALGPLIVPVRLVRL
jgi:hypothetical protein